MSESKKTKEVIVRLPKQLAHHLDQPQSQNETELGEYVYISTRKVIKQHVQPNLIREAMMKGYVEMSSINLSIACECLHLEYEAEYNTMERLVSGG